MTDLKEINESVREQSQMLTTAGLLHICRIQAEALLESHKVELGLAFKTPSVNVEKIFDWLERYMGSDTSIMIDFKKEFMT